MKKILLFISLLTLFVLLLFSLCSLRVTTGTHFSVYLHTCEEHTLPSVRLTLPQTATEVLGKASEACTDALGGMPRALVAAVERTASAVGEVFSLLSQTVLAEIKPCSGTEV